MANIEKLFANAKRALELLVSNSKDDAVIVMARSILRLENAIMKLADQQGRPG